MPSWPAESAESADLTLEETIASLYGEVGCSNLKRFGAESLDSSLTGEGSDDLATLITC